MASLILVLVITVLAQVERSPARSRPSAQIYRVGWFGASQGTMTTYLFEQSHDEHVIQRVYWMAESTPPQFLQERQNRALSVTCDVSLR